MSPAKGEMKHVMDKLDRVDGKIDVLDARLQNVERQTAKTNGKVQLHEKLIWSLGGAFVLFLGIAISAII